MRKIVMWSFLLVGIMYNNIHGLCVVPAPSQEIIANNRRVDPAFDAVGNNNTKKIIRFVFVVPSYNNREWYQGNLDSIFMQRYPHYRVIYVDDCSSDGTGDLVDRYVSSQKMWDRFTLVHNKERVRAMANIYKAVHMCRDDEIVVMLDGDDRLASQGVLDTLARVYADPNVWITFGSFLWLSAGIYNTGWASDIPRAIVYRNAFRFFDVIPTHLRTFYAKLFKKIKKEDLCEDGNFYEYTYDLAMMFPMMEMAGERFKFIREYLYIYNDENSINDHKINKIKQRMTDLKIRAQPPYQRIPALFDS